MKDDYHDLDLLVVEKVRGWERRGDNDWACPLHEEFYDNWDGKGPHPRLEGPYGPYYLCRCQIRKGVRLPSPSSDWEESRELFTETLDPNRTSIRPCGNGQDGLWWAIYYDIEMVCWHPEIEVAICLYALWCKGIVPEGYEKHVLRQDKEELTTELDEFNSAESAY
jgi:hypothetical protein